MACPTTITIWWPLSDADTVYTRSVDVGFGQDWDPYTEQPCEEIFYNYESFRFYVNGQDATSSFSHLNENEASGTTVLLDQTLNIYRATLDGIDADGNPVTVEAIDTVYVNTTPKPIVALEFNNNDNQNRTLCAADCFSVMQAVSSVPYISLDEPRAVTLLYDSDRAHPRPFVYADVSLPEGASAPQEFWLQARVKWNTTFDPVTFTNGDSVIKFTGSAQNRRLGAQIGATDRATGAYPLQLVISSKYPSATVSQTLTTRLIVVNEGTSTVAKGWTIAGLARIHTVGDTAALLTDGAGSAIYFGSRSCGASVCTYTSPIGEFSKLTDSASSTSKVYVRVFPDSTKIRFNYLGRVTSAANRLGHTTTFEYDGYQRLIKVKDPYRTITGSSNTAFVRLFYSSAGIDSIVSPGASGNETGGRATRFTVSSTDSTLRAARDPDGDSTSFTYDGSKRLSTVRDRRGNTKTLHYDSYWKLSSVDLPQIPIDAGGGTTQLATLSASVRPWQIVGVPSTSTASSPAMPIVADSVLARMVSAAGDTTSMTVNKWGMPLKITDALNGVTQFTYLSTLATLPTQIFRTGIGTAKLGYLTDRGLVATYQAPGQDSALRLAYGPYAQLDSTWGYLRRHIRYFRANTLSGRGRTDSIRVDFHADRVQKFLYDALGRVLTTIDPSGDSVHYHYDTVFGSTDSVRAPGGNWAKVQLDRFGRDSTIRSSEVGIGTTLYDVMNRVTHAYDSTGASPTVFGYDGLFLARVQDPLGQVYRYAYNALGWPTQRFDPADTLSRYESYRYNAQGLVTSFTNRRGQRVDQTFDELGRLISRGGTNVQTDSFGYSTDKKKVAYWNAVSRDSLFFSSDGWMDSAVTRLAGRRFRRFNAADPLRRLDSASVTGQLGAPTLLTRRAIWNADVGTLDSVYIGSNAKTGFRYDAEFRRDSTVWSAGNNRRERYTSSDHLYEESIRLNGGGTMIRRAIGRDSVGRIVQALDSVGTAFKGRAFAYDRTGRLATQEFFSLGGLCSSTDDAGYLCAYTADSSKAYRHDAVGNDTTGNGNVYATGNRLTSWGSITFEHDLDGNRTRRCDVPVAQLCSDSDIRYEFSATNRLRKVMAGADTTEYDYNALGELVRVKRNGAVARYYLWENGHLLAELNDTASQRIAQYVYGRGTDRPHALVTGAGTVRYLAQDGFGNIDGVFAGATVHQRRTYDPWGRVIASTGVMADTNRLGWKGLLYEGDSTRLYYMRNRWFDPETRRFVSEDPIGLDGGINAYLFAAGEPLNNWDPTGLDECKFVYTSANCPPGTYLFGVTVTAGSDSWGGTGGFGDNGGPSGIAGGGDPDRHVADQDDFSSGDDDSGKGEAGDPSNQSCKVAVAKLILQATVDGLSLTGVGAGVTVALAGRAALQHGARMAVRGGAKKAARAMVRKNRVLATGGAMQRRGIMEASGSYSMDVYSNIAYSPHDSWLALLPGFATAAAINKAASECGWW